MKQVRGDRCVCVVAAGRASVSSFALSEKSILDCFSHQILTLLFVLLYFWPHVSKERPDGSGCVQVCLTLSVTGCDVHT